MTHLGLHHTQPEQRTIGGGGVVAGSASGILIDQRPPEAKDTPKALFFDGVCVGA